MTVSPMTDTVDHGHGSEPNRRDFLIIASAAFAAVGAGAALWPLLDQMNPDQSALALGSIEQDVGQIPEGQAITVLWRGKPVFIRHRTAAEIKEAADVPVDDLKDRFARNLAKADKTGAEDKNRVSEKHPELLVLVGVCTHLGCVPKGQAIGDLKGDYGGWFCPCHGSNYDTSGRIRKGPAPENLAIPPYTFLSDTKIKIG